MNSRPRAGTYFGMSLLALAIALAGPAAHRGDPTADRTPVRTAVVTGLDAAAVKGAITSQEPAQSADVEGTITWPDGIPAANALIDFYPNGYPYGGQAGGERLQTDQQGRYTLGNCPCSDLGASYFLPIGGGSAWNNGGNECIIMLATADGALTGPAQPGDDVNWQMVNMPCSSNYLRPDSLNQEIAAIQADPQQLSGGNWWEARARNP